MTSLTTTLSNYPDFLIMASQSKNKLIVLQHNVNVWNDKQHALTNIYNNCDPDMILLNDHSMTDDKLVKIFNFNIHQSNKTNCHHRGTAIAIKKTLQYRLHDDFETDLLAVTVTTRQGPITIATDYIPPNSPYLHYIDYLTLLNRTNPVYILGDLNDATEFLDIETVALLDET